MNEVTSALLGVATGFILPSIAKLVDSRVRGTRFENAIRAELEDAKQCIHQKMLWLSRDCKRDDGDPKLLVEVDGGKTLFLGEAEEFQVALPFWENNIRDIIEATTTHSFNGMCSEAALVRRFVSKFKEMKMAFAVGSGDAKVMALACYRDLQSIHQRLSDNDTCPI